MHITSVYKTGSDGVKRVYYRLCESYRSSLGHSCKRMLCGLGYLAELPTLGKRMLLLRCIEDLAYRQQHPMSGDSVVDTLTYHYYDRIVSNGKLTQVEELRKEYQLELKHRGIEKVNLSTLKNIDPRDIGAEHMSVSTLKRLEVDKFLRSKGWNQEDITFSMMQVAARAIYPFSELRTVSYLKENSALCELMDIPLESVTHHRLYRSANRLYELHQDMENWLHHRVCSLFDLKDEILLFDLTNTYFEGRMDNSELAKRGRSKEKRSDCKIVVLAAVVNAQGMLVRTRIFEGNRGDSTTLQEIMETITHEQIQKGKTKGEITIVMDAGISTKENLAYLRKNEYRYVTVARSYGLKYTSAGQGICCVEDNRKQQIRLEKVVLENPTDHKDTFLLVDSKTKTLKERSMHDRSRSYFEDGLKAISKGIQTKGGTKKLEKVYERLGRLKNECPAVWKEYEIQQEHDAKNIVTSFTWERTQSTSICAESKHGKYLLQTNLDETREENIWFFYNVIRQVQETFRCLKSDLDIRPVYHKSDKGVKAHLNLAVLAYWVASTVRYQLGNKQIRQSWTETLRILQTHKIVSTEVTKEDQTIVHIRQCCESTEQVNTIYQALNINSEPIRKRKFVVHPAKPPD